MAIKKLIKMFWVADPKDNNPSVSLTLLLLSFTGLTVLSVLQTTGHVTSTGAFLELFYSTSALYFGRRLKFNNKSFDGRQEDDKDDSKQ